MTTARFWILSAFLLLETGCGMTGKTPDQPVALQDRPMTKEQLLSAKIRCAEVGRAATKSKDENQFQETYTYSPRLNTCVVYRAWFFKENESRLYSLSDVLTNRILAATTVAKDAPQEALWTNDVVRLWKEVLAEANFDIKLEASGIVTRPAEPK